MENLTFEDREVLARTYSLYTIAVFEITCGLEKSRDEVEKLRREIDLVPEGGDLIREALERLLRDERSNADRMDQERIRAVDACQLKREELKQQTAGFREYHANRGGFTHVFTRASEALAASTMFMFDDYPGFKNSTFSIGDCVSPETRRSIKSILSSFGVQVAASPVGGWLVRLRRMISDLSSLLLWDQMI